MQSPIHNLCQDMIIFIVDLSLKKYLQEERAKDLESNAMISLGQNVEQVTNFHRRK